MPPLPLAILALPLLLLLQDTWLRRFMCRTSLCSGSRLLRLWLLGMCMRAAAAPAVQQQTAGLASG